MERTTHLLRFTFDSCEKVLFGAAWPVVDFERGQREVDELGIADEHLEKLLWSDAVRVYGLEEWAG